MKIFLLSLLVLLALVKNTLAQNVDWNLVEQHYFEKYQPIDTPSWIFPIISINGDGQEDTCYYCYDSSAYLYNYDEINFGEIRYKTDTSNFLSAFYAASLDSFYSVQVFGYNIGSEFGLMVLNLKNAIYPITLKWNKQKLYDTTLPFPNIFSEPIAKIGGFWSHYYSPFIFGTAESFIQADTVGSPCTNINKFYTDSIVFSGPANVDIPDFLYIELSLRAQGSNCIIGNVEDIYQLSLIDIKILGNANLEINSISSEKLSVEIIDIYGRVLISEIVYPYSDLKCILTSNTIFFIKAKSQKKFQTLKILIP
jgi:hypothetical protein